MEKGIALVRLLLMAQSEKGGEETRVAVNFRSQSFAGLL